MNKKIVTFKESQLGKEEHTHTLPPVFKLKNITNQNENGELAALRMRIDELQSKVSQLETRIRVKRKRIRRKSNEVQKRYRCQFCKKPYGSIVSLNLHLRIKHKSDKTDRQKTPEQHSRERNQESIQQ